MSNETRTAAHAAIDRASPEDLARVAHDLVNDLSSVIDAIAAQAAAQTRNYLFPARPSSSPPPSQETEAELLQERQVVAIEAIAEHLETLASVVSAPNANSTRHWNPYLRTGGV